MRMLVAAVMMLGMAPLAAYAEIDGAWSGNYTQPVEGGAAQTLPFAANINERGSSFTGMTREPNRTGDADAATFAVLSGQETSDGRVAFLKTYATGGWTHGVEYEGHFVTPDRVEGVWHVGDATGPFVMMRN